MKTTLALKRFRLRVVSDKDRYVKVMLQRHERGGFRLWKSHALIEGLTRPELHEFARAAGIAIVSGPPEPPRLKEAK